KGAHRLDVSAARVATLETVPTMVLDTFGPVPDVIDRARSGDRAAFAELYDAHVDSVYRYLLYRVREPSDAEDLCSEVFTRAFANIHRYRWQGKSFLAWLYTIARNAVTDRRRRERPTVEIDNAFGLAEEGPTAHARAVHGEAVHPLRGARGELGARRAGVHHPHRAQRGHARLGTAADRRARCGGGAPGEDGRPVADRDEADLHRQPAVRFREVRVGPQRCPRREPEGGPEARRGAGDGRDGPVDERVPHLLPRPVAREGLQRTAPGVFGHRRIDHLTGAQRPGRDRAGLPEQPGREGRGPEGRQGQDGERRRYDRPDVGRGREQDQGPRGHDRQHRVRPERRRHAYLDRAREGDRAARHRSDRRRERRLHLRLPAERGRLEPGRAGREAAERRGRRGPGARPAR